MLRFNQDMRTWMLVNKTLESKEKRKSFSSGIKCSSQSLQTFTDKYGEKAETVYNSMALELNGLTYTTITHDLAATNS